MGTLRGKHARTHLVTAEEQVDERQGSPGARGTRFSGGANVQEFQAFYQENIGLIYRFVYSKVGNREEAEDLTSQIFIRLRARQLQIIGAAIIVFRRVHSRSC